MPKINGFKPASRKGALGRENRRLRKLAAQFPEQYTTDCGGKVVPVKKPEPKPVPVSAQPSQPSRITYCSECHAPMKIVDGKMACTWYSSCPNYKYPWYV